MESVTNVDRLTSEFFEKTNQQSLPMENYQIISLCLLSLIALCFIALIVINYKNIIRQQVSIDAQKNLLDRLIEVESAVKSTLPSIERNTGAAHKQISETLPITAKSSIDMSALLATRLPVLAETLTMTERSNRETSRGVVEVVKLLVNVLNILERMAKTHGDEATGVRAIALQTSIESNMEKLRQELQRTTAEVTGLQSSIESNMNRFHQELQRSTAEMTGLRRDFHEAIKF
jgi:hypothetical protein